MTDLNTEDVTEANYLAILAEASGNTTGELDTTDPDDTRDAPVADPSAEDVNDDDFLTDEEVEAAAEEAANDPEPTEV